MSSNDFKEIRFMNKVGLSMIFTGLITFLYAFPTMELKGYIFHGLTIGAYSLPLFVSGVYFHMLPGYNRRGVSRHLSIIPLLTFMLSYLLLIFDFYILSLAVLSTSFLVITIIIYICSKPIIGKFYYQKIIAFTSYLSAFFSSILMILTPSLTLIKFSFSVMFSIAVGMIFAVNSLSIPKTYKLEPRGRLSFIISILMIISTLSILYNIKIVFILSFTISFLSYLILIKIEKFPQWYREIIQFTEVSKRIHINLILGHIIHISTISLTLALFIFNYLTLIDFIHVLAFGFILPQITAHGPVLMPPILRKKPMIPKRLYFLSISTIFPTFSRILAHNIELFNPLSGIATLIILLMIPFSIFKK